MRKLATILFVIIVLFMSSCDKNNFEYNEAPNNEKSDDQTCPSNIAESVISSAYFSGINISSKYLQIDKEKCESKGHFYQIELIGKYIEKGESKSMYFHSISGGMAASGSDTYNEICLIIGGVERISNIRKGVQLVYQGPARCTWQSKLP